MYILVYASSAVSRFSSAQLGALLGQCRRNNQKLGVTGVLLYKSGHVLQVLEGEKDKLTTLLERIKRDPRHSGLIVLWQGEEQERQFSNWAMAFGDLDAPELVNAPGYSDYLKANLSPKILQGDSKIWRKLVDTFKHSLR